jgi:hypothetical protein
MVLATTLMALESLQQEEHSDSSSEASCEEETMQIFSIPMKSNCDNRKTSRRISWKFNTDWEGAISSFRSSVSASFNSWYRVLDIEDDSEDEDEEIGNEEGTLGRGMQRPNLSKDKSFKRSLHSTVLSDDRRTSFQSSTGDQSLSGDMNEYLKSLNCSKTRSSEIFDETSSLSHHEHHKDSGCLTTQEKEGTEMLRRLSDLINMKCDVPDLQLIKITRLEKEESELVQERVRSLQDLDKELDMEKSKARAA